MWKIRSEESLWWLIARALVELHERSCSALAIFWLFGSPPPLSEKSSNEFDYAKLCSGVPTTSKIESPPHIHFLCCRKPTKNSPYKLICTTNLHDQKISFFCSPPPLSAKSSNEFDYAKLCSGVPTTRKKNYDSICIHWAVNGLRRSPPRAENFGQKSSINH